MAKYIIQTAVATVRALDDEDIPNTVNRVLIDSIMTGSDLVEGLVLNMPKTLSKRVKKAASETDVIEEVGNWNYYGGRTNKYNILGDSLIGDGTIQHLLQSPDDWRGMYDLMAPAFSRIGIASPNIVANMPNLRLSTVGYRTYGRANLYVYALFMLQENYEYVPHTNRMMGLESIHGVSYLESMVLSVKESTIDQVEPADLLPLSPFTASIGPTHTRSYDENRQAATHVTYRTTGSDNTICIVGISKLVGGIPTTEYLSYEIPSANYIVKGPMNYVQQFIENMADGRQALFQLEFEKRSLESISHLEDNRTTSNHFYMRNPYIWNEQLTPVFYFRLDKKFIGTVGAELDSSVYEKYRVILDKYYNMDIDYIIDEVSENPDLGDIDSAFLMCGIPITSTNPQECKYLFELFKRLHLRVHWNQEWTRATDNINDPGRWPTKWFEWTWDNDVRRVQCYVGNVVYTYSVVKNIGPIGSCSVEMVPITINGNPSFRHTYFKQITATTCESLAMNRPGVSYETNEIKFAINTEDADDTLIPIDLRVAADVFKGDRELEQIIGRSLHYVFTATIRTKVKWYQTGIFKAFLVIVAIGVAIWSGGGSLLALGKAIAAGSTVAIKAALVTLLTEIAIGMVVTFGINMLTKIIGGKLALIIAAIAAIVSVAFLSTSGGIKGAPWAKDLLMVSSNIMQSANKEIMSDIAGVYKEMEALELQKTEFDKEIEAALNLLDTQSRLLSPMIFIGEKPDQFYERTIHTGNIGILSLSSVGEYYNTMLSLPEPLDTMENIVNNWSNENV